MKRAVLLLILLALAPFCRAQLPIPPTSFTSGGNITSSGAACNVGNCVLITLPSTAATLTVGVTGTFSATLTVEQSQDGARTWTSAGANLTAPGTTIYTVAGFTNFRVRGSAYTSGNAGVNLNASVAPISGATQFPGAPSGVCAPGELAVNNATGALFTCVAGTFTAVGGGGSVTGTGAVNQVAYWTGTSVIAGSANHTWNNATQSLRAIGNGTSTDTLISADAAGLNSLEVGFNTVTLQAGVASGQLNLAASGSGGGVLVTGFAIQLQPLGVGNQGVQIGTSGGANDGSFVTFIGNTSGTTALGVNPVAGTPNRINLPITTGTSGQVLSTDGGSPQQTSWITLITLTPHTISAPLNCAAASASGTAYTCTTSPTFVPVDGDIILFQADVANTGAVTLNVNASSAAPMKKQGGGTALVANDLLAGQDTLLEFDGTNWQMQGQLGNAPSSTPAFSVITSGTNTGAAMLVGTGASLGVTGSGTIDSTTLGGATFAAPGAIGGTTRSVGSFSALNCGITGTTSCVITGSGSTSGTATFTWPAVAGTVTNAVVMSNTLQGPVGSAGAATFAVNGVNNGIFSRSSNLVDITIAGVAGTEFGGSGNITIPSTGSFFWNSAAISSATDLGISRTSAGVLAIGTGAQGSTAGRVGAAAYLSVGTKFTTNAGCSETTLVGGATAGSLLSGVTGTCAFIVTMGNTATAANGWACNANDVTTPADVINEPSSTTTTASFSGPTVSGDKIVFSCIGY